MASAPNDDDLYDRFLERRGHETTESWDRSYNKKQCPDCGALHDMEASECAVCGWADADVGAD